MILSSESQPSNLQLKYMMKTCSIVKFGTNEALTDPFTDETKHVERSVRFFIVVQT